MHTMIGILEHFQWHLTAAAALLAGFALGALFGRARIVWRLRSEIQEAQDRAEWERARREDLARQLEEARNSAQVGRRDGEEDDAAAVSVLRRELDRLRQELHRTLEGQGEAQRRIQELEARITVMAAGPSRRIGSAVGSETMPADGTPVPRQKPAGANVLTLWNQGDREPAGDPDGHHEPRRTD